MQFDTTRIDQRSLELTGANARQRLVRVNLLRQKLPMTQTTLYEFSLCPFCNKVRAGLELKGIPFDSVEVSPRSKKELPPLPEDAPKKVPVLQVDTSTVFDSTTILDFIDETFPGAIAFRPDDEAKQQRAREIEDWVDNEFIAALPTVIYGTWGEATQAARVVARNSKFTSVQKFGVQMLGSVVMHQISKRIMKRHGRTDAHGWVRENVGQFTQWLGDNQFVTGDHLSIADVAMHGALTCVREFPIFEEIMSNAKVAAWYKRIDGLRQKNRATNAGGSKN